MNYDWKGAVRKAQKFGAGSSGQLSGYDNIKFWSEENKWMFKDENNNVTAVKEWRYIPVQSIYFKDPGCDGSASGGINNGLQPVVYSGLNSRDQVVIDELTRSIMRGDVKIIGRYASVNNIGYPPAPGCPEVFADVPVPIRRIGEPIYAHISKTRVTRGTSGWYIHTARIGESTGPGYGKTRMQPRRVYMCGD